MSRSLGGTRLTTRSPMRISPPVISSSPAIMRSKVVLPQPLGPTSTANSPSEMSTSTPRMTWVRPNCLYTLRIWTDAIADASLLGRVVVAETGAGSMLAGSPFDHYILRPSGAGPVHQVLHRFAPQLDFGGIGVEGGMRREQRARVREQRVIAWRRLGGQHVKTYRIEAARFERVDQIVRVDDRAARGVDEDRS